MRWIEKFRKIFMAATFAEAGEWDEAREIIRSDKQERLRKRNKVRSYNKKRPHVRAYKA